MCSVGGHTFATVVDLKHWVRTMLSSRLDLDRQIFDALLEYHPERERKLRGRTVLRYTAVSMMNGMGLILVFDNGSTESVSWNECCRQAFLNSDRERERRRLSNAVYDLKKAARNEVWDQIQLYRRQHQGHGDGRLDHVGHDYITGQRFEELLRTFVEAEGGVVEVRKFGEVQKILFHDRGLAARWSRYHQQHAILRMETRQDNLRGNIGFKQDDWAKQFVCINPIEPVCR